jgi:AcrR family transcriptional regulator
MDRLAMARTKELPSEASARDRILVAAREVFASIGFAGARVDDIAARAGVNKAMLYYHVGDKEQLYSTVLTETLDRILLTLREETAKGATPGDKFQRVLDTFAAMAGAHPHLVPIMLREIASGGATLPDEMILRMAAAFRIVSDILAEGRESGAFRQTDPLLTHVSLIGNMMFLIATQPIRARLAGITGIESHHTFEDLARHTGDLFRQGLEVKQPKKTSAAPRGATTSRSKR